MNKIDFHIAKRVRALRIDKGLSQEELASLLGKNRVTVVNMERGTQSFTVRTIYLLCSIFNVTPNDLFPAIKNATVTKQKRQVVIIKPTALKVTGLPKV